MLVYRLGFPMEVLLSVSLLLSLNKGVFNNYLEADIYKVLSQALIDQ